MSLMVSISGIRGIVGSSLTPEILVQYASAFARSCGGGPIILGRDGRITGKNIGHIVSSTLLQSGYEVIAIGPCPTPTVQLAVEKLNAAGGISITASHNPIEWNGLKFIAPSGMFLDAEENQRLQAIIASGERSYVPWNKQGNHRAAPEFVDQHIASVLSLPYIDTNLLKHRKLKVVVDCVNAAGGVIVPKLLRELGCNVIEMNCDVSGIFAHAPEPIPENLGDLCERVKKERADLGIAVDPDVDRLVLITEQGEPFGEEYTIASVVKFILEKESPKAKESLNVVVNLSTTHAIEDIAEEFRATVIRTAVGEINVAKKMKEIGAIVGGEGSGGVILPQSHLGRDAIVGIGLILQSLTEFGGPVSAFKKSLPQYHIAKGKMDVRSINADAALENIKNKFSSNGNVTTLDGVKIDFSDSWVHFRKSNTEPIVRIITEAPTKMKAEELMNQFMKELTA